MQPLRRRHASSSLRTGVTIAILFGVTAGGFTWYRGDEERRHDIIDVDHRASELAQQVMPSVAAALGKPPREVGEVLGTRLEGYGRLIGIAVYDSTGHLVAAPRTADGVADSLPFALRTAIADDTAEAATTRWQGTPIRVLALQVRGTHGSRPGIVAVFQDVSSIETRVTQQITQSAFWILFLMLLLVMVVVATTWLIYDRQLVKLAEWMRRLRTENVPESPPGIAVPLLASESDRLAASLRAARSVGLMESSAAVRAERVWTRDRLRTHAVACLENGQLVVVSNREPYMHQLKDGAPTMIIPAGGLVSALDPVLQACGGLWVAQGAGDADRETADPYGRLTVPPGDPRYTLRRVWITREEEQGYYYGFANEGLWPLCHLAHERPTFRAADWAHYVAVNERFADAVLDEIGNGDALVLVQDYQLALVPAMIKRQRPDLRVGLFWHIPWPNPEAFRICPWRNAILRGVLGADLVGFHLQQYCNNFLDTVDRMLEARVDRDRFAVELRGHSAKVGAFPISVSVPDDPPTLADLPQGALHQIVSNARRDNVTLAVGVDRIDYTKGLPERFRAVARFLERYPQYHGRFSLVQLGAPSRAHIPRYRALIGELESLADEINWKYQTDHWKPIHFHIGHSDGKSVHAILALADICLVSSLHDGMNLVAKEFVAARRESDGVLVLSEFAGAARELADAVIINPYDVDGFAEAIRVAVEMDPAEQRSRMARMQREVEERNVYRWAATLLTAIAAVDIDAGVAAPSRTQRTVTA